jgi:hypothetical protein
MVHLRWLRSLRHVRERAQGPRCNPPATPPGTENPWQSATPFRLAPDVLERYAARLQGMSARERRECHERNSRLAAAGEERAPCWLRLMGAFTVAGLDAISAGGDPAQALAEAVAKADADAEDVECAVWRFQHITEERAQYEEARRAAARAAVSERQLVSIELWDDDASWRRAIHSARRTRGYNL